MIERDLPNQEPTSGPLLYGLLNTKSLEGTAALLTNSKHTPQSLGVLVSSMAKSNTITAEDRPRLLALLMNLMNHYNTDEMLQFVSRLPLATPPAFCIEIDGKDFLHDRFVNWTKSPVEGLSAIDFAYLLHSRSSETGKKVLEDNLDILLKLVLDHWCRLPLGFSHGAYQGSILIGELTRLQKGILNGQIGVSYSDQEGLTIRKGLFRLERCSTQICSCQS